MMFEENDFEYDYGDDNIEEYIAPMDLMYKIVVGEETFESTLEKTSHVYTSNITGDVVAHYNLATSDFVIYPFDPINIRLSDIEDMLQHYVEIEDYEKCAVLLKKIKEFKDEK